MEILQGIFIFSLGADKNMLDLSQNAPSLIFSEKLGSQTISSDNDSMEIDVIVDGIPELSETEKNSEDFIGFESEITG